jgi:hypothetical protein
MSFSLPVFTERSVTQQKFFGHFLSWILCPCLRYAFHLTDYYNVKQSHNRPGVAQRVPGGLGSHISWHSAREGGEVSLTHRPPLPPGMLLVLIFTRGWVDHRVMERSEGDMSLKIQWHHWLLWDLEILNNIMFFCTTKFQKNRSRRMEIMGQKFTYTFTRRVRKVKIHQV